LDPRHTAILFWSVAGVSSYLLGSIPFGLLVARARGVDIRQVGSRNIGATNVFRSVGKTWGILTFILDFLKGFIPAVLFPSLASRLSDINPGSGMSLYCACLAIAGHSWPIYIGFKGGKGVATGAGGLLAVVPIPVLSGLVAWIAVFLIGRYVSVASICAAMALAVSAWLLTFYAGLEIWVSLVLTVLSVLVIVRHHANITRLFHGTEHRFSRGSARNEQNASLDPPSHAA